ncbi:MAG TPA: carboxypeptidase regulatory-like domain-containing protein [Candidatus Acidoferrum sp.]|nr:carboxypeptidase regulatory-like domain-containing protein [Candidatus Acidoferrum sp.]
MNLFARATKHFAGIFAAPGGARDIGKRQANPKWAAGLLLLAVASPAFAHGAQTDGSNNAAASIHGTISIAQQAGSSDLSGIGVTLNPMPASGSAQTTVTDDAGSYEFKGLKPGNYTISINQQGFKAVTKSVTVTAGQNLEQNLTLELETVTQKIEVREANPIISTESVAAPAATVSHQELISLPTPQEKIREVLPITPGVVRTPDGKLNFKGADENQSLFLVNAARTGDPVTGSFSIPVPTDAVESFAVYKAPFDAGLGSFSGGVTTIDTKPPAEQWNFYVKNIIPSVLGKNDSMVGIAEATPGVDFGGPLLNDKLFFSEVFQYDMKKTTVRGLPWPDDITKRQGFNSFSTVEAILSPQHILTLTVNAFPLRQQNYGINALVPETASNDLNQKGIAAGLSDKYQFKSGANLSLLAQYTRFDSTAYGQGLDDMTISPEGWGGNFFNRWSRRGKSFQFLPSYQLAEKHWLGKHELRFGVDFDYRSFFGANTANPIQLLSQAGALAEQINFDPGTDQIASDTSVAEFVQDHWTLNSHWTMDAGARLSSETSGWAAAVAPRLGIAYSPDRAGKTIIRAGTGLFYSQLPLLAADFAVNPTRVVSMYDSGGQLVGNPITYTNAYVGSANPLAGGPLPIKPDTTPRNFTWNMEVDHELRNNVILRFSYLDSHTTYLFVVNPFTGGAGTASFLGLANTGSSHYRDLESTVHFTLRGHNEVNASYIWSRTRGDLNNLSDVFIPIAQPVIRPNVYGILPADIPNRFVTWGVISLPRKFIFSPIADFHTGYPYSNVDALQNYVGTPDGQRFATFFSLDVKVYRVFQVPFLGARSGKTHHMRLGFYSLNVTNHGNFNAVYNNVTAPNFGQFAGFLDRRDGAVIDFID